MIKQVKIHMFRENLGHFFSLLCYRNLEELLMHCMCLSRFDLWDNLQPSDWMSLPCFSMYIFFFPTDRQSNPSLHQVVLPLQIWTEPNRRTDGQAHKHTDFCETRWASSFIKERTQNKLQSAQAFLKAKAGHVNQVFLTQLVTHLSKNTRFSQVKCGFISYFLCGWWCCCWCCFSI